MDAVSTAEARAMERGIGNTPLVQVCLHIGGLPRPVHLKLEGANPGMSVKDRTAHSLVESLERQGRLSKGSVLVESTSGNLGVALAFLARARGYGFVAVVDPKTTAENLAKMRRFGARIDLVTQPDHTGGYLLSRLERVQELCARSPRRVWTDQYGSPANPAAHASWTGPEILRQMQGRIGAVVLAVSTGGTLAGIAAWLRRVSPATRIIGVDARGSVVFGGPPGPRKLTGIGSSRRSSFLTPASYDEHIHVGDAEAFAFCRALHSATGLHVGGSSGAVLAATAQYLAAHPEAERVVSLCADHGQNYASTIYQDAWLAGNGLLPTPTTTWPVTDITLGPPRPFVLAPPSLPYVTQPALPLRRAS
ncbi:MAG TPA: pyridoxal-phosphate dependent enzyme [Chloroflexota bacterium]|nr:pyridoxal-phosphate dependent enzyme [Chloroflexota bacterium]